MRILQYFFIVILFLPALSSAEDAALQAIIDKVKKPVSPDFLPNISQQIHHPTHFTTNTKLSVKP